MSDENVELPGKFSAVYKCDGVREMPGGAGLKEAFLSRSYGGFALRYVSFEFGPAPEDGRGLVLTKGRKYRVTVEEVSP